MPFFVVEVHRRIAAGGDDSFGEGLSLKAMILKEFPALEKDDSVLPVKDVRSPSIFPE